MKGNPIYRVIGVGIIVSSILAHLSGQADFTQLIWLWIPIFMAVMMIQATFTGFCPMSKFFGEDPETGACCGSDTRGDCCSGKEEASQNVLDKSDKSPKAGASTENKDVEGVLVIKVLGTGCANCVTTYQLIEQQAQKMGVSIQLEKVEEMAEIASFGVMSTPAIVINGQVVYSGSIPSAKQVEAWLIR